MPKRISTNDLELYLFELPKFTKTAAELKSPMDVWLYFFRNAAMIDTENVPTALRRPAVLQALEELIVLAQTAEELEHYESRRKAQLDHITGLKAARMEGRMEGKTEGIAEGEKRGEIKRVQLCERLLKRSETPAATLAERSFDELDRRARELEDELGKGD
jgi:predicted transposase/invertase (TIGR01784 family)